MACQVLYVAHTGDSGAVMACAAFDLQFPLRLTADHKPNRPDEHARIQDAGGNIDEARDRVVSDPKPHNHRVTLLNMSRCAPADVHTETLVLFLQDWQSQPRGQRAHRRMPAATIVCILPWTSCMPHTATVPLQRVAARWVSGYDQASPYSALKLYTNVHTWRQEWLNKILPAAEHVRRMLSGSFNRSRAEC